MHVTPDDLLLALGESAAENFALRRRVHELEGELGTVYRRIEEANMSAREEPQPIHAQPDPQLWPERER